MCVCGWMAACVGHVSGCHHQRQRQSQRQLQQRNTRRYWLLGVAVEKNSKGAASADKTQIWRTSENSSRLPMLPTNATHRNTTRPDELVPYTAQHRHSHLHPTVCCARLLLCFAHYYGLCVLYARGGKLASKSDRCVIYSFSREFSNYPFKIVVLVGARKCK